MTNNSDTVLSRLQMLISGIADAALEEELKQLLNQTKLACFEHCWTSERFTLQEYAINELVIMGKSDSPSCVPQVSSSNQPHVQQSVCRRSFLPGLTKCRSSTNYLVLHSLVCDYQFNGWIWQVILIMHIL